MKFEDLKGLTIKTIEGVEQGSSEVNITTHCGRRFRMSHHQDCCESVEIVDVCGDPINLINAPLMVAEEATNSDDPQGRTLDSFTWTFYRLATVMGYVVIRWLGESNGYYSESVDFEEITNVH